MANRIACILSLMTFVLTLTVGTFVAQNTFGTSVLRALGAMLCMLVAGYVIGLMAERMLADHVKQQEKKILSSAQDPPADGR
jgi:positive regulator of sigma E activity